MHLVLLDTDNHLQTLTKNIKEVSIYKSYSRGKLRVFASC